MTFDLTAYLGRIGLNTCPASLEGLQNLQAAQMRSIPFENIEPFLGAVPDLAPEALWQKLITSRRGGYCFELNALLGLALNALGFAARPILARVRMGAPAGGPRAHLAWVVTIETRHYLVDAGFGGPGALGPIEIVEERVQHVAGTPFRIVLDLVNGEHVLQRAAGDDWFSLYSFDDAAVTEPDIEAANVVCARWDKSPFPSNLMLNLHRAYGRVSLFNCAAKLEADGALKTWTITTRAQLQRDLAELFQLRCDDRIIAVVWKRLSQTASLDAA